jgi:hypothetical protein
MLHLDSPNRSHTYARVTRRRYLSSALNSGEGRYVAELELSRAEPKASGRCDTYMYVSYLLHCSCDSIS